MAGPNLRGEQALETIRAVSPESAAGYKLLLEVLDRNGALPAAEKALFIAAAAATQGQRNLARQALERAREHGLDGERARGAVSLILINRGEVACADFADAIERVFGPAPAMPAATFTATVEEALDYYRQHFGGEVPARQRLFAELGPSAFVGYFLVHRASLKRNVLPARTAELLLCTVVGASYQPSLLEIHMRSARREGATDEEVTEALLASIPVAGFTAWASGAAAIAATRSEKWGA